MTGLGFLICALAQFYQAVMCLASMQWNLFLLMTLYGLTNLILFKMHLEGKV